MPGTRCAIGRARTTGRSSCKIRATFSLRPAGTARCARSRSRRQTPGVPFAALPIGTANNIAKTLELLGDAHELVRSWEAPDLEPIDLGEVRAGGESRRFVEGVGGGWFAELIARSAEGRRRVSAARARNRPRAAPARGPPSRHRCRLRGGSPRTGPTSRGTTSPSRSSTSGSSARTSRSRPRPIRPMGCSTSRSCTEADRDRESWSTSTSGSTWPAASCRRFASGSRSGDPARACRLVTRVPRRRQ